jgi:hypothetical protein
MPVGFTWGFFLFGLIVILQLLFFYRHSLRVPISHPFHVFGSLSLLIVVALVTFFTPMRFGGSFYSWRVILSSFITLLICWAAFARISNRSIASETRCT